MDDTVAGRHEVMHRRMTEKLRVLDGTTTQRVALLAGISVEDIDRLGGIAPYPPGHAVDAAATSR